MTLEIAAAHLSQCSTVAILSGAGISAESGIPTFREAQTGLWAQYDPVSLATPTAFRRTPDLVWAWYMYRYDIVQSVEPNAGHYALADMEDLFDSVVVLTQNIDGFHHDAGSSDVIELHGSIQRYRCFSCSKPVDLTTLDHDKEHAPRCPHCEKGRVRPSVVWFNEGLPPGALDRAVKVASTVDALLVIGTSGLVHPAASLPDVTRRCGGYIVEVNPNATPITPLADVALRGPSGEMLPRLVELIRKEKSSHD